MKIYRRHRMMHVLVPPYIDEDLPQKHFEWLEFSRGYSGLART